jgi:hypothetical protein
MSARGRGPHTRAMPTELLSRDLVRTVDAIGLPPADRLVAT